MLKPIVHFIMKSSLCRLGRHVRDRRYVKTVDFRPHTYCKYCKARMKKDYRLGWIVIKDE
jgi:hypothetical protein